MKSIAIAAATTLFAVTAFAAEPKKDAPKTATLWAKKTPKSKEEKVIELGKEFIKSHKKAFSELKKEYWTEENKKLILSKKKDLNTFLDLAKGEIAEVNEVMKKHGIDTTAIVEKIESIYQEKKWVLENFAKSPAGKSIKRKLAAYVGKIKKDISG